LKYSTNLNKFKGSGLAGGGPGSCGPADRGMINDPSGCEKFFHCNNGNTLSDTCPPGTHFNETAKFCDDIANINPPCVSSISIDEMDIDAMDIPKPPYINVDAGRRNLRSMAMRRNF
jgi:hypothetical protein